MNTAIVHNHGMAPQYQPGACVESEISPLLCTPKTSGSRSKLRYMQQWLVSLLAASCLLSCDTDDRDPAFLRIESFDFSTEPGEGTDSEKITELWVYEGGTTMIGAYDLPATIPLLSGGNSKVRIYPGIKNNGISSTRIIYPFYNFYEFTATLTPGEDFSVTPEFSYREDLDITEYDFESGIPFESYGVNSGEFQLISDDRVFEGDRSGYATLAADQPLFLYRTQSAYTWSPGEMVFLEMNYSCNNSFGVGLYAINGTNEGKNFAVILNPTREGNGDPEWNKIYIDLGFVIKQNPDADYFELYIESVHDTPGNEVELYFDNLKLVQYD